MRGWRDLLRVWLDLECAPSGAEAVVMRGRPPGGPGEQPFLLITQAGAYGLCPSEGRLGIDRGAEASAAPADVGATPAGFPFSAAGELRVPGVFRVCYFAALPRTEDCGPARELAGQFVVLCDGEVIARARSLRTSPEAAEVWVETDPGHRRRGYGRQVCSAWARKQMAQGLIAFYCYGWANAASRGLARSLGLAGLADAMWRSG